MCFVVIINKATHFLIQSLLVYSLKELKKKKEKKEQKKQKAVGP